MDFLTIVRQNCKLIPVNNPSSRAAEGFGPMKLRQPPNGKVLIPTGHAAWQMSVQTKVSVICIDGAFFFTACRWRGKKERCTMNLKKLTAGTLAVFAAAALLAGCGGEKKTEKAPEEKKKIVVGITPGYSEEIMEFVKDEAKKQGLDVELKVFSDYVTPDQALAQKEIDLNSFQHGPFLDAFNKKNGTKLVSIGKTYLAPLKLYSTKIKDIKELKDGDKIAIPNDPSNGGRAILMLSKLGLIKVKDGVKASDLTVNDITDNPKHLQILELEAAQLPRSLDDTAASVINAGYANSAKLDPNLAIAKEDNTSPYVNIIAAREEDKDNPTYVKFVKIFQTDAVKNYINEKAKGALVPAW